MTVYAQKIRACVHQRQQYTVCLYLSPKQQIATHLLRSHPVFFTSQSLGSRDPFKLLQMTPVRVWRRQACDKGLSPRGETTVLKVGGQILRAKRTENF